MVKKVIYSVLILLGLWVLAILYVSFVAPPLKEWWVNRIPSARTCYNNRRLKVTFCKPENWEISASLGNGDGTSPEKADVIDMYPPGAEINGPTVYIRDFLWWSGYILDLPNAIQEHRGFFSDYTEIKDTHLSFFNEELAPISLKNIRDGSIFYLLKCENALSSVWIKSKIDVFAPEFMNAENGKKLIDILQSLRCYEPKESDG